MLKLKDNVPRKVSAPQPQPSAIFTECSPMEAIEEEKQPEPVSKLGTGPAQTFPRETSRPSRHLAEQPKVQKKGVLPTRRNARTVPDMDEKMGASKREGPLSGHIRTKIAAVLLILVALLGISSGIALSVPTGSGSISDLLDDESRSPLSGKVVDMVTGRGIEGVTVTLIEDGITTTTNDEGFFLIENLKNGEHTLVVKKQGYTTRERVIDINSRSTGAVLISMSPGVGKVEDEQISQSEGSSKDSSNSTVAVTILLSVLALISAWLTFKRIYFPVAFFFALLAPLSFGFGFGVVLGITALVFLMAGKSEFKVKESEEIETF